MIQFEGNKNKIKGKINFLKTTLHRIAKDHNAHIKHLQYIFVDDEYLLELNNRVLKHDYYTDIITFDYSENKHLEGEIYISTDRVADNAIQFNAAFHVELARVVFHGVLHMLGYKDKSKQDKSNMRKAEDQYIQDYLNLFHVEQ